MEGGVSAIIEAWDVQQRLAAESSATGVSLLAAAVGQTLRSSLCADFRRESDSSDDRAVGNDVSDSKTLLSEDA